MAEQGRMELAADVQGIVEDAIASGQFASREEMISEALRQWKRNHSPAGQRPDAIRDYWSEALHANGPYHSMDEVFDPLEAQYAVYAHPGTTE